MNAAFIHYLLDSLEQQTYSKIQPDQISLINSIIDLPSAASYLSEMKIQVDCVGLLYCVYTYICVYDGVTFKPHLAQQQGPNIEKGET